MVQFNFSERTIKAKVVYYGPAQSGKTTNLEQIHRLTDPDGSNRLISLNTAQDRTLFFDLLPFSLGAISGYDFKIQLYTVPGQVQYNATRRVVLAGADAVVFVADIHRPALKDNVSAFENMKVNLLANRLVPEKVPLVLQYNKQDLPDVLPVAELNRALNLWGRRAFPAIAPRGDGVIETFVAIVQEMLTAIAIKYNLAEKGLDPAQVPDIVSQAFAALLRKQPPASPAGAPAPPLPRVVISQPPDSSNSLPLQATPDSAMVSEELLHRAIRSNVELAETLGTVVREVHHGLGSILTEAGSLLSADDPRRSEAVATIQREASRLRQLIQQLGRTAGQAQAAAPPAGPSQTKPPVLPTAPAAPSRAPVPPAAVAAPQATPAPGLDGLLREAALTVRAALQSRGVGFQLRVPPGTLAPTPPAPNVRRATGALLTGLAALLPPGSSVALRCERKPVLLKTRDGDVKRDFLMLAFGHPGVLSDSDQQRVLQGADGGPLGESFRLVREMGGFLRYAPMPGGAQETRVFLPAPQAGN
jgi:signal recognition particle receptor subunit beta